MDKLENILIMQKLMKLIDVGRRHNVCEKDVIKYYLSSVECYSFEVNPFRLHEIAYDKVFEKIIDEGGII